MNYRTTIESSSKSWISSQSSSSTRRAMIRRPPAGCFRCCSSRLLLPGGQRLGQRAGDGQDSLVGGHEHGAPLLGQRDIAGVVRRQSTATPARDAIHCGLLYHQAELIEVRGEPLEPPGVPAPASGGGVEQLQEQQ